MLLMVKEIIIKSKWFSVTVFGGGVLTHNVKSGLVGRARGQKRTKPLFYLDLNTFFYICMGGLFCVLDT